jgi:hypothetical protein
MVRNFEVIYEQNTIKKMGLQRIYVQCTTQFFMVYSSGCLIETIIQRSGLMLVAVCVIRFLYTAILNIS